MSVMDNAANLAWVDVVAPSVTYITGETAGMRSLHVPTGGWLLHAGPSTANFVRVRTAGTVFAKVADTTQDDVPLREPAMENTVSLFGERFAVECENDTIYVSHPQWSLMGAGHTRAEAIQSLLAEAEELAEELIDEDPAFLSESARQLRAFALRLQ